ncbi:MAG: F0F1 ATP synthase subunit alpha, partial [Flavobacteriales bacterium CG03_land_8_20_14_0_80_35_15]
IYAGSKDLLRKVPVNKVKEFESDFLVYLNTKHLDVLESLKAGKLSDEAVKTLELVAGELASKY